MGKRPSRREWFLGLVGAVFGGGAARAVERRLPGTPRRDSKIWLVRTSREGPGTERATYTKIEGKVEITPGTKEGTFRIAVHDRDGKLVEDSCQALRSVYLYEETPPVAGGTARYDITSYPASGSKVTTYTFDAKDRLVTICDPPARLTYYTYEGSGRHPL